MNEMTMAHAPSTPDPIHSFPEGTEQMITSNSLHGASVDQNGLRKKSFKGSKILKKIGKKLKPSAKVQYAGGVLSRSLHSLVGFDSHGGGHHGGSRSNADGNGLSLYPDIAGVQSRGFNSSVTSDHINSSVTSASSCGSGGGALSSAIAVRASLNSATSKGSVGGSRRESGLTSVCHDYTDYSELPESEQMLPPEMDVDNTLRKRNTGGVITPFPERLHQMLGVNQHPDIVSWAPHGRCFLVRKPKEFESTVMPLHFNHTKITSFQRQLNLYGFKRITRGVDRGAYYHELFLRGRPKLCTRMRRQKVKGTGHKPLPDPDNEPNFYAMKVVTEKAPLEHSNADGGAALTDSKQQGQGDQPQEQQEFSRSYLKRKNYSGSQALNSSKEALSQLGSLAGAESNLNGVGSNICATNSQENAAVAAMAFGTISPDHQCSDGAVPGTPEQNPMSRTGDHAERSMANGIPDSVPSEVEIKKERRKSSKPISVAKNMFRRSSFFSKSDAEMSVAKQDMEAKQDIETESNDKGETRSPRRHSVSATSRSGSDKRLAMRRRKSQSSIEMCGSSIEMGSACRRLSATRLSITSINTFNRRLSMTSIGSLNRRLSVMSCDSFGSFDALERLVDNDLVEQRRASVASGKRWSIASGSGLHMFKEQHKGADENKAMSATGSEDWIEDQIHCRRHSLNAHIDFDEIFEDDNAHLLDGDAASV